MSATSTSGGGSSRNGCSRSSGGHHGTPSAAYTRLLVGRVGQRLERRDVLGRARGPQQRGAEPLRLGDDELDRHALDRHAQRPALLPARSTATICGSAAKRVERCGRVGGGARPPRAARTSRASGARRRRPSPPSASAMPPTSSQARLSSRPCRGRGSPSRASASSSRASVFGPTPGTVRRRPAAAASRSSSAVRTSSARAISTDRLRAQPEVAAEADEVGRQLALELGQLGDLAGLDQLLEPARDPRPDAAQLAHPARGARGRRPGRACAADRLRRATVGARLCTGSPRPGRAARRTRPGDRRSARCPPPGVFLTRQCRHHDPGRCSVSVRELRVAVTAPDYDEALTFYRDVLGLRERERSRARTGA